MLPGAEPIAVDKHRLREEGFDALDGARVEARVHCGVARLARVAHAGSCEVAREARGAMPIGLVVGALPKPLGAELGDEALEGSTPTVGVVGQVLSRRTMVFMPSALE